jgi:ABC-type amino acid transport substrate-binding protein
MTRKWIKLLFVAALGFYGSAAVAQDASVLTGTLKKARNTGVVTIGYRDSSVPFSYLSPRGKPIGYSIDICRNIVEAISEDVGHDVNIKWVQVTAESRINAVMSGQVDLECGSTTDNLERQKQVAFSPIIFVAGTKLMVGKDSPIKTFRDLQGKTVVVTAGTTNEKALHDLQDKLKISFTILTAKEHADSFAMLTNTTFASMAESHELEIAYNHWFLERLPSGDRLELTMSPQLDSIFRSLAVKPE